VLGGLIVSWADFYDSLPSYNELSQVDAAANAFWPTILTPDVMITTVGVPYVDGGATTVFSGIMGAVSLSEDFSNAGNASLRVLSDVVIDFSNPASPTASVNFSSYFLQFPTGYYFTKFGSIDFTFAWENGNWLISAVTYTNDVSIRMTMT